MDNIKGLQHINHNPLVNLDNHFRNHITANIHIPDEEVKNCYLKLFDTIFYHLKSNGIITRDDEKIESKKQRGGNTMTITEVKKPSTSKMMKKMMKITKYIGMIILMIYFSGVLIESYRLICFQIERIHRARATYLDIYGDDTNQTPEDENFISYIMTFFKVMHEVAHGSIIQMIDNLKSTDASNAILNLLKVSSSEATRGVFEACSDNYFGCINGFFTGVTTQEIARSAQQNIEYEIQSNFLHVMNEIRKEANDILFKYNSSVTNFVTAISGLEFVCVLGLNIILPDIYHSGVVVSSFTLLQTSYSTQNIFWRIGVLSSQLLVTLTPGTIYLLQSIFKPQETITQEEKEPQFNLEIQTGQSHHDGIGLLLEAARREADAAEANVAYAEEVDVAAALLGLSRGRRGGNNKYRKKIQKKTKRKKTKRNKTKKNKSKRKLHK